MQSGSNDIVEKFKALRLGEKIILIAGLVLFIDGFLPWYSADVELFGENIASYDANGWEAPGAIWSIFAILVGLAMVGAVCVRAFSPATLPDNIGGQSWPRIYLGAAAAAALFIVIKLINESSYLSFGFYIGILCVAALVVAGGLLFQEEQRGGAA
jgi:hypothetical protein